MSLLPATPGSPPPVPEDRPRPKIGERGPDGKVYLGRAIYHGRVRFLSVSAIKKYNPDDEGCPRRWFYQFKEGKKEDATAAQTGGTGYAKQLEDYLKTGVDKMQPILRAAKHLFPVPGPDLEVEKDLAVDIGKALAFREMLFDVKNAPGFPMIRNELKRWAGLSVGDIPLTGAADCRHRRGTFVDVSGTVRPEDPGMRVCSIDDLKTTKRINDHTTSGGKVLSGYAMTVEEVVNDIQMVGYGVHEADAHPETTHVRLAHNYAQTANGFAAVRRMGLVPVERLRRRWESYVEPIGREMEGVAAASKAEDVPTNTGACRSYGRECPHMSYCQPQRTISDLFEISGEGESMTTNGLFDNLTAAPVNGAAAPISHEDFGLFGSPMVTPQLPPPIPAPIMSDADRAAGIAAERAKLIAARQNPLALNLEGYTLGQNCNGIGYYQSSSGDRSGHIAVEPGHTCPACQKMPAAPHIGAVNPLDAPPFDPVAAAAALTQEQINAIPDPEIRGRAQALLKATEEQEALAKQAEGKPEKKSSNCSAGGTTILLTDKEKVSRKKICSGCNKELKIKDKDFTQDLSSMVVPKHRHPKAEAASVLVDHRTPPVAPAVPAPVVVAPQTTLPAIAPEPPPIPPAPPEFVPPVLLPPVEAVATHLPATIQMPLIPPVVPPPVFPTPGTFMQLPLVTDPLASVGVPLVSPPASTPLVTGSTRVLLLTEHIIKGVALGLDTKESAFDRIAALMATTF